MGNVSENLTSLLNIKSDIKLAIEEKGQDLTGVSFDGYAGKIRDISTGGNLVVTNELCFGYTGFEKIPNGWDFSEKTEYRSCFQDCGNLKSVADGQIPWENIKSSPYMFSNCGNLESITDSDSITIGNDNSADFFDMFGGCNRLKYPSSVILKCPHITNFGNVLYPVGENKETDMDVEFYYPNATEMFDLPLRWNSNDAPDSGFDRLFLSISTANNIGGGFGVYHGDWNLYNNSKSMTLYLNVGGRSRFNASVDEPSCMTIISGIGHGDDSDEPIENPVNWSFYFCNVDLTNNDFKNFNGTISFGNVSWSPTLPNYRANLNYEHSYITDDTKYRTLFNSLGNAYDGSTIRINSSYFLSDDVIAIATSKGFIVES